MREDIDIQFTGIRPGEKLYEELNVAGETHVETAHPKILVAQGSRLSLESISRMIDRLRPHRRKRR